MWRLYKRDSDLGVKGSDMSLAALQLWDLLFLLLGGGKEGWVELTPRQAEDELQTGEGRSHAKERHL